MSAAQPNSPGDRCVASSERLITKRVPVAVSSSSAAHMVLVDVLNKVRLEVAPVRDKTKRQA